jgi:hypothetical protein
MWSNVSFSASLLEVAGELAKMSLEERCVFKKPDGTSDAEEVKRCIAAVKGAVARKIAKIANNAAGPRWVHATG